MAGEGNTDDMSKSAEEAGTKITELKSKLEAEKAEKSQLDQVFHSRSVGGTSVLFLSIY